MTIRNVTAEDEGVYSVIARLEPMGEARSTAELYLSGKEVGLGKVPQDIPDSSVHVPEAAALFVRDSSEFYHYEERSEVKVEEETVSVRYSAVAVQTSPTVFFFCLS
ncbi:titin-like [Sebastes fasciatus]|uniref:titin-like n=1 Tax=Sebastes fasciatus TaxID=394691 RepID=UPI003D9EF6FF